MGTRAPAALAVVTAAPGFGGGTIFAAFGALIAGAGGSAGAGGTTGVGGRSGAGGTTGAVTATAGCASGITGATVHRPAPAA